MADPLPLPGALGIALVGHRHNRLQATALPRLAASLGDLLDRIGAAARRPAALITGMAEGADLIGARARPPGMYLHAVLTEPMDGLAARMGEADATVLRDLLSRANATTQVLDGLPDDYVRQAKVILDGADLLVAVWDGDARIALGGTADTILRALAAGLPVIWQPVDGGAPHRLEAIVDGVPRVAPLTADVIVGISG